MFELFAVFVEGGQAQSPPSLLLDSPRSDGTALTGAPFCFRLSVFLLFLVLATVWILGSDYLLLKLAASGGWASFQTVKGWLFVTVTSGFLLWIIHRQLNALYREQRQLQEAGAGTVHLFENSPIGPAVLDREGRITQWTVWPFRTLDGARTRCGKTHSSSFCTEPGL